jgi:hypothetical protein
MSQILPAIVISFGTSMLGINAQIINPSKSTCSWSTWSTMEPRMLGIYHSLIFVMGQICSNKMFSLLLQLINEAIGQGAIS